MPLKDVQKTHSQHAVPQNIMDVEFKLIGDLTMRQFTYLMVFGFIAYLIYISVVGVFKLPLALIAILLGLALAFVPIQERGMDEWFVNFFKAVYAPTQMVWRKESILPPAFTYQNLAVVKQELITLAPTSSRRKLEEYLELQQSSDAKDRLDIPEREYILKVRQAFAPVKSSVDIFDDKPGTGQAPYQKPIEKEEPKEYKPFTPLLQESTPEPGSAEKSHEAKPLSERQPPKEPAQIEKSKQPTLIPVVKKEPEPALPAMRATQTSMPDDFTLSPITPDRHSGRRFTRVLPSEGQLILPVRGEKVIETSEETDIQRDIQDKTAQLQQLLNQIKSDNAGPQTEQKPQPQDKLPVQEGVAQAQDVVKKVKEENERLSNEIQKLRKDIQESQVSDEEKKKKQEALDKLEKEKNKADTDYSALQRQVLELQRRLKEQQDPTKGVDTGPKQPTYAKMQPITNDPNVVSGVLKNNKGDILSGLVLLIKNHKGESVRALKTNALGQFSISTPLVNGLYTLEVGSNVEGQTFDIITIEVKGEVIPPIELLGRAV